MKRILMTALVLIPTGASASVGPWFQVQLGRPIDVTGVHVTGKATWAPAGDLAVWSWEDDGEVYACVTGKDGVIAGPTGVATGTEPSLAPLDPIHVLLTFVNGSGHVEAEVLDTSLSVVGNPLDLGQGSHPAAAYVPGVGPAVAFASGNFVYVYTMRYDPETFSISPAYRVTVGPLNSEPSSVSISCPGDVNGDGKPDLFVSFQMGDTVYVVAYSVSSDGQPSPEGQISLQGENPYLVGNVLLYDDGRESEALILIPSGTALRTWDVGTVGPGVEPEAVAVDDLYLAVFRRGDALDCSVGVRFSPGSAAFYPDSTYTSVGCLVPATVTSYAVGAAGDVFEVFVSSGDGAVVFPVDVNAVNPVENLRSAGSSLGPLILAALTFTAGVEAAAVGPDAYEAVPTVIVPLPPPSCRRGPRASGRSSSA